MKRGALLLMLCGLWFALSVPVAVAQQVAAEPERAVRVDRTALAVGEVLEVVLEARVPAPVVPAGGDAVGAEREARTALREHFSAAPFAALDYAWEVVAVEPVVIQRRGAELGAELIGEQRVRLVPFEAGELALPRPDFPGFAGELPTLTIASALAPGVDTARPPAGLSEALAGPWELPEPPAEGGVHWSVFAGSGALGFALAVLLVKRARRRQPKGGPAGSPRGALEGLATSAKAQTGAACQAAHYQLTALTRAAWERAWGLPRSRGTTDAEWIERHAERFAAPDAWRAWFAACAEIKYGGAAATAWGLEERARFVLAELDAFEAAPAQPQAQPVGGAA